MRKSAALKRIDDWFGPLACRVLSRPQTATTYPSLRSLEGPLLVVRPGGIGDAVMLLPMLAALRACFPGRRIDVLCEQRNSEIFALFDPGMERLLYDTTPLKVLRRLRGAGYAGVLDTEQFHHFSGVLGAWTQAPIRVGFKLNTKRNPLYTHLVSYDLDGAEDTQFGRLLRAVCPSAPPLPPKFALLRDADVPAPPADLLRDLAPGVAYAVVHAGGSAREKRWTPERYARLCDRLNERFRLRSVLVGSAGDKPMARAILRRCRTSPADLCGALTLPQTAAVCRGARVFAGPDSGIAHLAQAMGLQCAVLFGPSDPLKWGPGPEGRVVDHPVPCGPCAIFGYNKPCRTYACMQGITAEAVEQALTSLLE